MAFEETRLPTDISYGVQGGPMFNTSIFVMNSGHEKRNRNWSLVRHKYDLGYGEKTQAQIDAIIDFFYARNGMAYGFRFKDWQDYQLDRASIGTTDGTTQSFQVIKTYTSGTQSYSRDLTKIVADGDVDSLTFAAWVGGVSVTVINGSSPAAAQVAIDRNTGILTLGTDYYTVSGDDIEVECEFDVPVRFDTDHLNISIDSFNNYSWDSIPIVEIRDIT